MGNLEQRKFNESPTIINASEPHMALVFLLDTSYSMKGEPIRALNEGLNRFKREVCENSQTKSILDIAIIEFNSSHRVVQDFVPIEYMDEVNLAVDGSTNMVPAIRDALRMVDDRSRFYRTTGTEPYKPWVLLITDGEPDHDNDVDGAEKEIKAMEDAGKVSFRSLGVEGCNFKVLHQLCGKKVLELKGTNFTSFFDWVNKSMRSVSLSSPGDKPKAEPVDGADVAVHRSTDDWD